MQEPDKPARVADRLLEPCYWFRRARTGVFLQIAVFRDPGLLVCLGHGEDEEEGVGWAWDEGDQVGLVDGEDVGEAEGCGESELVHQVRHHLWVVFCRELAPISLGL